MLISLMKLCCIYKHHRLAAETCAQIFIAEQFTIRLIPEYN